MRAFPAILIFLLPTVASAAATKPAAPPASNSTVNVNEAGEQELRTLPGIGREEARKIVAGRPYSTPEDFFRKARIAPRDREALLGRIRVGDAPPASTDSAGRPINLDSQRPAAAPARPATRTASERLDVNTATIRELCAIHGLVPFAPRIVKFRPYRNLGELSKAGVPRDVILECSKYLRAGPVPQAR